MYTEMALAEKIGLFCAMGVLTGTIGINYAHELMHKSGKIERWLADAFVCDGSILTFPFRTFIGSSYPRGNTKRPSNR